MLVIKNASELLTLRGGPRRKERMRDLSIIQKGAVAVEGETIAAVGKSSRIDCAGEVIDAEGKVVMPGFVDPHTHLIFDGTREEEFQMKIEGKPYMEIMKAGGGIYYTVDKTRKATKEELKKRAVKTLTRMLQYGTTTIEAKSGYGLDLETEVKSLECIGEIEHCVERIPTYLVHAVPKGYSGDYTQYVIENILPHAAPLAEFVDVFCEEGVFSFAQTREIVEAARHHGLRPRLHVDEFSSGGAELAADLKCLSADHLENTTEAGIQTLAESQTAAILLPGTPFVLNGKYPDARRMIEAGALVGLATDFNPNCMTESMQFMISLACIKMRMTPAEAIAAATVNAAYSVGREDIGSLEVGTQADIIVLDIPNYKHMGYHFGINLVDMVVKKGKVVYER
ncbi:MAG: imidazolonepropionase [Theionarchaea archaeon]|nr:imidazolonepropionase [Theionarchaea archaeon]MBU7036481.1 imidazolonepropionase [Theionarchaea archaeon]